MALVTTLLTVETCPCQVYEAWDDALPADQQMRALTSVVFRGPEHQHVIDKTLLGVMREEQHRKTVALAVCVAESATLALNPSAIQWSYTPGRVLQLSFPSVRLSGRVRHKIQDGCEYR